MNLNLIAETGMIETLGWTLVHSLWQFALVAGLVAVVLHFVRGEMANARYAASAGAMAICVILSVLTFVQVSKTGNRTGVVATNETTQGDSGAIDRFPKVGDPQPATRGVLTQEVLNGDQGRSVTVIDHFLDRTLPSLFPFFVGLWLIGIAVYSARLVGGVWKLNQYKTGGIEPLGEEWTERFRYLCHRLGVERTIRLLRSNLINTPIAAGVLKPVIIVPAAVFLQIDPQQLECIIVHELVHIRRFDPLVNVLQSVIEILFFYHPAVWWISTVVRREREFAADAAVTEVLEEGRVVYATALANLEEIRHTANTAAPSVATAANGGNLMLRIQRILDKKAEIPRANSAWSAGLAIGLISAVLLCVFSFSPRGLVNAQRKAKDRKLAIGFVGIPPLDRTANPPKDADATARLLIAKLQEYKVPAIGFLTGSMVSDGEKLYPVRANIVRMWHDAGLEVGIGNFKHIWFYNTPYDEYVAGVEKNETVAKKLLGEKNLQLRYFSYPYLNTGRSVADRDRFEAWLGEQGLKPVKYTIDNQEWMYSFAYDMARNDNDVNTMTEIRVAFVKYMDKMFDHYEAYSQEMFGRQISQTMVLTPSRLVADSADELFAMIRNRGYAFVPIDEALADEAYKTPENMFGEFGNSWFERWTYSQGKKLRDEPKVDAVVDKIWREKKPKS